MKIEGFIWLRDIVDKLFQKHQVQQKEVEEVFANKPRFTFVERGKIKGENLYSARGQTNSGRYLSVLFIYKKSREALIITARDMDSTERKAYGK